MTAAHDARMIVQSCFSMSVFSLHFLDIATTLRHGMWNPFTIGHTVYPLVDKLLFLCLIKRIARSEKPCIGLGIDAPLCLLLQPLQLRVNERREKAYLGSLLPDTERFFSERLLLHSLVAFLSGTPECQGLEVIVVRPNIRLWCTEIMRQDGATVADVALGWSMRFVVEN